VPEINFAREILAIVRAFLLLGMRTQPILHFVRGQVYRIILSRLYYAAHHVGRALLKSVGLTPERWRVNVHRRVLDELEHRFVNTGAMRLYALEALENLRWLRSTADYDLNIPIREANITDAINFFEIYFNECCQILGSE
jgi:uncharacterized protein (UPF0332 family)